MLIWPDIDDNRTWPHIQCRNQLEQAAPCAQAMCPSDQWDGGLWYLVLTVSSRWSFIYLFFLVLTKESMVNKYWTKGGTKSLWKEFGSSFNCWCALSHLLSGEEKSPEETNSRNAKQRQTSCCLLIDWLGLGTFCFVHLKRLWRIRSGLWVKRVFIVTKKKRLMIQEKKP